MTSSEKAKKIITDVVLNGTVEERRLLFEFNFLTPRRKILKKFKIFARSSYPRFFRSAAAEFHDDMIMGVIKAYFGEHNFLNLAFRGSAKTSLAKLLVVFVILNDKDKYRKYLKILTRDGKNAKQFVTDCYNLIIEAHPIYGDMFEKSGSVKREETMGSFTLRDSRKLGSGTVGQTQRGHIQDAYRPDFLIFDDCEDRESITSVAITQGIMNKAQEALDGLSKDGSYLVLGNYISDQGVMEWFKGKTIVELITPILKNDKPTWDAYTVEDIQQIKKDADDFYGEYMCDPARSENKFFDLARIEADLKKCTPPVRTSAGVRYWTKYLPHHRYGQGSDHSDGIGKDANTLAGFDFHDGLLAYTYANNEIGPDLAVHEFARVGSEFGNCIYAPEINNKCGGIAITTLKGLDYPNIYQHVDETKSNSLVSTKYGWETNRKTKYNMFFDFRKDYNDGLIKILDKDVLMEMKAYSNADLQEEVIGLITKHFDLLTAAIIGWQMRKHAVVATGDLKSYKDGYKRYIESLNK